MPHSQFWAYQNAFTGTISESFGAWTNLEIFQVWENDLTGSLPSTIGAWSNMDLFGITHKQHHWVNPRHSWHMDSSHPLFCLGECIVIISSRHHWKLAPTGGL